MKHSVSELKLKNGAKGLLIHVPDASVMTFEMNFRAGDYLADPEKWEVPHIMEHLLLGANKQIPKARTFQAEFEKNGAYSNASTGAYDIIYEAECADFEWDRILDLLTVAISEPLFLEEEFAAEFGNVREELTGRSNNHFRHLSLALRESYGFAALTDQNRLARMKNVTLKDIKDHYKKTHTTNNFRFVIAGNIDSDRRKIIKKTLETIKLPEGDGRLELPEEHPHLLVEPLVIPNKTVDNLYFYMDTFLLRRLRDPELDALSLINTMLTETLYSRILGKAREKGLVYHVSSGISQTSSAANWWFGAQVMPSNAPALFDIIVGEIEAVFKGKLNEKDIQAAKQYSIGRYQRGGQTVGGTMAGYSYRYFFDEAVDDYYKVPARIKAITRDRILDVTQSMFADKVWGIGFLGDTKAPLITELNAKLAKLWK